MKPGTVAALAAASSLALAASTANATVYYVDRTVGLAGPLQFLVTGTITTDGTLGDLAQSDVIDWNLLFTAAIGSFRLEGPLSGNNSYFGLDPGIDALGHHSFWASSSGLFFSNYSGGDLGFTSGVDAFGFSTASGLESVKYGSVYASSLFGGEVQFATTPEPATWTLMLTGFAGLGAALRSRRRLAAAS